MKILFLSRWFPYPPDNGSKLRVFNLLRGLSNLHEVTLLAFADKTDVDTAAPELRSICRQVQAFPWKPFNPGSLRALLGLFDHEPRAIRDTFSPQFAQAIRQTIENNDYDVIIASQVERLVHISGGIS